VKIEMASRIILRDARGGAPQDEAQHRRNVL